MYFSIKKIIGVKNKGTILLTNHFDLGWKENLLIKIDWDPEELSRKTVMISTKPRCPRGVTLGNFCWVCAACLSEPLYPILVTLGQICNFCDPNLVTFYLFVYLINPLNRSSKNELTHFLINWIKNALLFTYSTNILVRLLTVNIKTSLQLECASLAVRIVRIERTVKQCALM